MTRAVLNNALNDKIKSLLGQRLATDVLTSAEEQALVEWIQASARGKDPAKNEDISEKVVIMLKARRAENKKRKHCPGCVAPSA